MWLLVEEGVEDGVEDGVEEESCLCMGITVFESGCEIESIDHFNRTPVLVNVYTAL